MTPEVPGSTGGGPGWMDFLEFCVDWETAF